MIWKYEIRIQIVTILSPSIRQVLLQEITKHKFSQKDLLTHIYQLNTFAQLFSHIIIRYNKHCLKIKLIIKEIDAQFEFMVCLQVWTQA